MKILVFGAGVLGSVYAARLDAAGQDVEILARGERAAQIRRRGVIVEDEACGKRLVARIPVVEELAPNAAYDLILVVVRKNQLASVLPSLAANRKSPNVLFFVNNAEGAASLVEALGAERVMLGFPGAGGTREGSVIRYRLVSIQATTIGEPDGRLTPRLVAIATVLRDAGFRVAVSKQMDGWLKTHVALVSPVANALYLAEGDNYRLARTRDGLVLLVRAVKEGLGVLNQLGIAITPAYYRSLRWIPEPLLVGVLREGLATETAALVLARHANAARDEMKQLADEFQALARSSGRATPAIDRLYQAVGAEGLTMAEGRCELGMRWWELWPVVVLGAMVATGAAGWSRALLRGKGAKTDMISREAR